jgi:hypothetical protein
MRTRSLAAQICLALSLACAGQAFAAVNPPASDAKTQGAKPAVWDKDAKAAAAKYLDAREVWWQSWPRAQKDHGTVCLSCHTNVPYALARPVLRDALDEDKVADPEQAMLNSILTRVKLGKDAKPFYNDLDNGEGKTEEAINAESVQNALVLVSYDVRLRHLSPATRAAFERMWDGQAKTGPQAGAWVWQNFHYSPWESDESEYYGAAMAAMAVGMAPDNYRGEPAIQSNIAALRIYLKQKAAAQPLINRVLLLWASARFPGLLSKSEQGVIAQQIYDQQQVDGGWSLETMGTWKRRDDSKAEIRSDSYATGLSILALEETGIAKGNSPLRRGLLWLTANQDRTTGMWPAWSVNKQRDPATDIGKFMSDAGTAFAVMALEKSH